MPRKEICDVCGQEIYGRAQWRLIEGAKLKVCQKCAKFGTQIKESVKTTPRVRNKKGYRRKSSYRPEFAEMELVEDFNKIIKREREKRGWTQEELGKRINIRPSLIRRIESGQEPTDDVREKLEKIFGINLLTVADIDEGFEYKTKHKSEGLTLGDIVHLKKKKYKT
ncbi:MAG: multiprotein bridging factor aMBF1 [Candidatus Helarchaeota archaeon]